MKTKYAVLIIASLAMISFSQAQLIFGVKPGLLGNSAQFGIKLGSVVAFGGLEYMRVATTTEESGQNLVYQYSITYPYSSYGLQSYDDKYEMSANLYAPFIGAKISLGGVEVGKVRGYLTGIIGKPIITGKSISNGVESESIKKFYKGLSAWMFMAGFGAEYFFSENFSIGGEFGLRVVLFNYQEESSEVVSAYDYQTGRTTYYTTPRKYDFDLGLGITYSSLVLNYYF
jgi:hypothetical protein